MNRATALYFFIWCAPGGVDLQYLALLDVLNLDESNYFLWLQFNTEIICHEIEKLKEVRDQ